jgi:hypothetical protein
MRVADPLRHLAGREIVHRLVGEERDLRVEQREIEVLAYAGFGAMRDRGAHRDAGVHAGHHVDDRHPDALRSAARQVVALAGDAHQAAHALNHEVVARLLTIGPGMTETGYRAIDEARVYFAQILVAETVTREVAELVVLQQHVAARGEIAHDLLPLRIREIDRDRLLAAIGGGEIGGLGGVAALRVLEERRRERARIVAFTGSLDLDDLGAEVGEVLPGPRCSEHARKIEHTNMG